MKQVWSRQTSDASLSPRHPLPRLPRYPLLGPPNPSFLAFLPPLDIPSISEAEITRFRGFETKALQTDRRTDGQMDG